MCKIVLTQPREWLMLMLWVTNFTLKWIIVLATWTTIKTEHLKARRRTNGNICKNIYQNILHMHKQNGKLNALTLHIHLKYNSTKKFCSWERGQKKKTVVSQSLHFRAKGSTVAVLISHCANANLLLTGFIYIADD